MHGLNRQMCEGKVLMFGPQHCLCVRTNVKQLMLLTKLVHGRLFAKWGASLTVEHENHFCAAHCVTILQHVCFSPQIMSVKKRLNGMTDARTDSATATPGAPAVAKKR